MRRKWIGTGWKMNHSLADAKTYATALMEYADNAKPALDVVILPPFTALAIVSQLLQNSPVKVGAQNMHWDDTGAWTGEISPTMLVDCGAQVVEIGHSERRTHFGETDVQVNAKALAAVKHGLQPIICVGETAHEKNLGAAVESVSRQVRMAVASIEREKVGDVIIAYEPVWAIGAQGKPSEPSYANEIHLAIRQTLSDAYGDEMGNGVGNEVTVVYGGSVNPTNALPFIEQPQIDGLFIGRSAWAVDGFIDLIELVTE